MSRRASSDRARRPAGGSVRPSTARPTSPGIPRRPREPRGVTRTHACSASIRGAGVRRGAPASGGTGCFRSIDGRRPWPRSPAQGSTRAAGTAADGPVRPRPRARSPPAAARGSGRSSGRILRGGSGAPRRGRAAGACRDRTRAVSRRTRGRAGHDCARSSTSRHSGQRFRDRARCVLEAPSPRSAGRPARWPSFPRPPGSRDPPPAGRSRDRVVEPHPISRAHGGRWNAPAGVARHEHLAAVRPPHRGEVAASAARPLPASSAPAAPGSAGELRREARSSASGGPTRLAAIAWGPKGTATGGISRITPRPPMTSHRPTRGDRPEPR